MTKNIAEWQKIKPLGFVSRQNREHGRDRENQLNQKLDTKEGEIWELSIKTNVLMYNNEWFKIQSTKRGSYDPD